MHKCNIYRVLIITCVFAVLGLAWAEGEGENDVKYSREELIRLADQLKTEFKNGPIGGEEGWDLNQEKNGINIYTRKVDITPVKSFRGEIDLECDLDAVVGLISYDKDYPEWMYLVEKSRVVEQINETDMYVYTENQPIWPCKIRDACTFKWWHQDPETFVVTGRFIDIPDLLPERKGYIRVPLLMGQYVITPEEGGIVHITYEALTDPDIRWVPDWAVSWTVKWCAHITLNKMKEKLPLTEYKAKAPSWLKVPGQVVPGQKND